MTRSSPSDYRRLLPALPVLAALLLGAAMFAGGTAKLRPSPEEIETWQPELRMVWPELPAVLLAGGDPYLAANLKVIRAMAIATKLRSPEQKTRFARLMESAIQINPANADGYYLAQAVLPWNGFIERNQAIQREATRARPWDWLPPFFSGFNLYYFKKSPGEASSFLHTAAQRSPGNRDNLKALAAHWTALGHDPQEALRLIDKMAKSANSGPLAEELRGRKKQLQGLIRLQTASEAYRQAEGHPPPSFQALIGYGGLKEFPGDPMGEGFALFPNGEVRIAPPKALKNKPRKP